MHDDANAKQAMAMTAMPIIHSARAQHDRQQRAAMKKIVRSVCITVSPGQRTGAAPARVRRDGCMLQRVTDLMRGEPPRQSGWSAL